MWVVFALCALVASCAVIDYSERDVEKVNEYFHSVFRNDIEAVSYLNSLTTDVRLSFHFSLPIRAYVYYAAVRYCKLFNTDVVNSPVARVLKFVIAQFPKALYENSIGDSQRALDVLAECPNKVSPLLQLSPTMLDGMDPFKLLSLPRLAERRLFRYEKNLIQELGNVRLSTDQVHMLGIQDIVTTYSPFITPALLERVFVLCDIRFDIAFAAASDDVKQMTVFVLQQFQASAYRDKNQTNGHANSGVARNYGTPLDSVASFLPYVSKSVPEAYWFPKDSQEYMINVKSPMGAYLIWLRCNDYGVSLNGETHLKALEFILAYGNAGIYNTFDFAFFDANYKKYKSMKKLTFLILRPYSFKFSSDTMLGNSRFDMWEALRSSILDPNCSLSDLVTNQHFNEPANANTYTIRYISGFSSFIKYAHSKEADAVNDGFRDIQAHCAGQELVVDGSLANDFKQHKYPCRCLISPARHIMDRLGTYTRFGQLHCIQQLENDDSINWDSDRLYNYDLKIEVQI